MSAAPTFSPRRPRILSVTPLVVVAACAGGSTVGDPEPPLRGHMQSHFDQAVEIQSAVVRGDLTAVDEPAVWLATHETPALPSVADPFIDDMRSLAQRAADADDLAGAAAAVSRMARTCGSCHTSMDGGPSLGPVEQPRETTMVLHAWAMDRMWEGLVAPSDARWVAGAEALVASNLELPANASQEARSIQRTAARLGASARDAANWGTRTEIYGDLLVTCAGCHDAVGIVPR